jgi:alkylation response protein AidB-like acyl-CoA dehydrogenase
MYSFEPTEEQQMLIDTVKRYAERDLREAAHEAEEGGKLPDKLIQKGWELGLLQASMPEELGGFGEYSAVTGALAAEELAFGDLAGALAVLTPNLFALPLLLQGDEAQAEQYIPQIVDGAWQPYTAAFIEPFYDFDPSAMRATAEKDGDSYILQGEKAYVPFAADAPAMLVYADLDGETQAFIVEADTEGLTIGDRQKLLGLNALPLHELHLDQVQVAAGARLGGSDGHDFAPLLDSMRVGMAALGVGLARASFDYSRDYAKQREVLGSMIAQKQSIAFMLAEMATEIEATRLLTWEAAWQLDEEWDEASETAYLAHSGAGDMAMMVTDRGVQILGGHGYIREHPVELWMRNGRGIATLTGLALV